LEEGEETSGERSAVGSSCSKVYELDLGILERQSGGEERGRGTYAFGRLVVEEIGPVGIRLHEPEVE
jgi:hypothetical protein